ncbi:hypothetical protein C3747_1024g1 [Trypanosoma cruzi]|uniref:Uncharacterized protein n=1 Tax=Trypanosoma cruzi TaxID=5693 RepID=A0A2V2UFL5_TRYCR|nr:hypothetical protein C3747_1024g1 [Trypanosoma cruzi]
MAFPVLCERQPTPELEATPYLPDTVVLQLYRDDGEAEFAHYMDANSLTLVALGDTGRPALCGIDAAAQLHYEGAQRALVSAAGMSPAFAAVVCVFPSACQNSVSCCAERTTRKKATAAIASLVLPKTALLAHAFSDAVWVEESFHCFSMTRRVGNILVSTGIGSTTRDLAVDKWRLDQDNGVAG